MSDTLTTTTTVSTIPSGTVISTDDAGASGHVQIVKLAQSADGSATPITADANGMEVQGAGVAGTPAGGVHSVQGVSGGTAVPVSDNAGSLTVDAPVATPVFVRLSDGSAAIATLPVSLASVPSHAVTGPLTDAELRATAVPISHAALTELAAAIDTEMQVDIVGALPAGTNAIGKLAANSGVDIGDVDVTSLPSTVHSADFDTGAGTDTTLAFGIAVPASGGAAVIPGDATAGLKVDLGADNDVTVTGSVTANAGTNLNTSALALESGGNLAAAATSLATLDNAISGSEMQVDVVAALPAGDNNIGNVDLASAIPAGTNNIGDVDVASIAAGDNNIGNVDVVTVPTDPFGANADAASSTGSISAKLRSISAVQLPAALGAQGALKVEGVASGTAIPVSIATVPSHAVTNAGTFPVQVDGSALTALQLIDNSAADHDAVDVAGTTGVGVRAVAHGASPTAVAAADRTAWMANRHGIPFVMAGHPNIKSSTYLWTGSTTDDNIMAAIAGGSKYAITRITIALESAITVQVAARLGFGTANVPALPSAAADAVDDILFYHPGMVPGSCITIGNGSGILGVGGDGAELRLTAGATTGGTGVVTITWYNPES